MTTHSHASIARELRDFISAMLDMPPRDIQSFLINNAEDVIYKAEVALGTEAFTVGDRVISEVGEEFAGVIAAVRCEPDCSPVFTVKDQNDDAFDVSIGEIRPNIDN